MKSRIAILGYKDFIDLTKGITKNINKSADIDVYQCLLDECLDVLPILEGNQTDIIITGRANQQYLEKITKIPIITFRITAIDILLAIKKAMKYSNRITIAMARFEEFEYNYSILNDLLNIKFEFLSYNTQQELEEKIKAFSYNDGTVIGTTVAINYAKKYNLNSILIYSLKNTILESINRAIEIIEFNREEEKSSKVFEAVLNSVSDGIITTNDKDELMLINQSAYKLLTLEKNIVGQNIKMIFPEGKYPNILNNGLINNELLDFNNTTFNVNRLPVMVKEAKVGNVMILQDITKIQKLEQNYRYATEAKGLKAKTYFKDIIFETNSMEKVIAKAKKFSKTESTILIIGETGTGKELFAQSIHNFSKRKDYPFVTINCGALPENLLESELFGYEDGAFTGANKKGKKGLFEIAHGGTVFLDEINSISLHFQSRLLRVLQEREIIRVGGNKVVPINIRIIAAANENLIHLVKENKFRTDLFYRLNVLKLSIPPLRQRIDDITPLTKQFIFKNNKALYYTIEPFISDLCNKLKNYRYTGNIRELYNVLERFMILCGDNHNEITKQFCSSLIDECMESDDELQFQESVPVPIMSNYKDSLLEAEKRILSRFFEIFNGNKTKLIEEMGVGRTTLYRKLKDFNLE